MREHPAVAGRLRCWTRRLRTATVSTVVAATTIIPAAPALGMASPEPDAPSDAVATSPPEFTTAQAPLPATADGDDSDTATFTGSTTPSPHGHPAEWTTFLLAGTSTRPEISTSQVPPEVPRGTGLTRAPPERQAYRA